MATLAFPDVKPDAATWGLIANTKTFVSDLDGSTQNSEIPGAKWSSTLTFTNRFDSEARSLYVFLARLNGMVGRFRLTPPDYKRVGTALGTGAINGADQTGNTLITDGWDAGQPLLFAAGDYIEVNGELKMIVEDVSSDGTGNAILTFSPSLRSSPLDDTLITTEDPKVTMMLTTDDQSEWNISSPVIYAMSISCIEAIGI